MIYLFFIINSRLTKRKRRPGLVPSKDSTHNYPSAVSNLTPNRSIYISTKKVRPFTPECYQLLSTMI